MHLNIIFFVYSHCLFRLSPEVGKQHLDFSVKAGNSGYSFFLWHTYLKQNFLKLVHMIFG